MEKITPDMIIKGSLSADDKIQHLAAHFGLDNIVKTSANINRFRGDF